MPLLGAKHPRERINDVEHESAGSFEALLTSLSNDPLTKGKQFERLVKWWLTQDPIWSRKIKNVWLWDEWPDYPGRDIGIDLVAEMTDGTLCAVQAKCFDENRDIPKSELDSFISAASHRTFQHRLLVSTTDGLSANAKRMLADQHVVRVMRSDLESSLDLWPASIDELSAPAQPHASPRPHQNLAITDVTNGFKGNSRGQLIMACGTGKTLTALWIKETLTPKTTLVLVPSLNLLAQTLSEWAKNSLSPWQYLCVCSDDTVNKLDDQPISTVGDLPFEVTTNPADIAKFLTLGGERIIFSTYQSSAQVAKAQEQSGVLFDLVICDEAHRLTGKTDADYATVLDEKKIVGQKRLFMTATPRTYTTAAKTKAEDRGVEITSMDDEHVYGPVLHKLSFGEAIKQELLSDYRVLIVGVTDPQVQDLIDRRELVSVNDSVNTDARTLAAHIGLAKATKDYNLKRTISFHSRIKSADQFAKDHLKILDWLPDTHKPSGNTWTGTISGAMNTGDRRRLIKQLSLDDEDRHALLTNARCLTEGVDVPSLDGVAFIDPRSSQVDIIQAVGRAIRRSKNKEIGTIVLPVLIPTDSDAEEALEDTAFKPIWAILNALKSHDDDFASELNNLRIELGRTGNPGELPTRLVEDLPADIDSILPGFSLKLSIAILEHSTSSWEMWFGLLLRYSEEHGHAHVNQNVNYQNKILGQWVNKQRTSFRRNLLSQDQISKLESLPQWTWDPINDLWTKNFLSLQDSLNLQGEGRLLSQIDLDAIGLRYWVHSQRSNYRTNKLSRDRILLLETLSGWSWDPLENDWDTFFTMLIRWREDNLRPYPIKARGASDNPLGDWVVRQRSRYHKGWMSSDQIHQLESLEGWSWNPNDDAWNEDFNRLEAYVAVNGKARPPVGHLIDDFDVGIWVAKQRDRFRRGRVLDYQRELLEALPQWSWDPIEDSWETMFSKAQSLPSTSTYSKNGKLPIELVQWFSDQRERYRMGKLSESRTQLIESLTDWQWSPAKTQWKLVFDEFKDWAEHNSTNRIPKKIYFAGINGNTWVQNQRTNYRTGKLSVERIALLESINGWAWTVNDTSWIATYNELMLTGVTPDLPTLLREWIQTQKKSYSRGKMPEERIKLLELVPQWTWGQIAHRVASTGWTQTNWEFNFDTLRDYTAEFGTSRVSVKVEYNGIQIGKWVSHQRDKFKKGKLSPEQVSQLSELPGWTWSAKEN